MTLDTRRGCLTLLATSCLSGEDVLTMLCRCSRMGRSGTDALDERLSGPPHSPPGAGVGSVMDRRGEGGVQGATERMGRPVWLWLVPLLLLRVRECDAEDRGVREGEVGGVMMMVSVRAGGETGRGRSVGETTGVVGSAVVNDSTDDAEGSGVDTARRASASADELDSGVSDMFVMASLLAFASRAAVTEIAQLSLKVQTHLETVTANSSLA